MKGEKASHQCLPFRCAQKSNGFDIPPAAVGERHIRTKHSALRRELPISIHNRIPITVYGIDIVDFRSRVLAGGMIVITPWQCRNNPILCVKDIFVLNSPAIDRPRRSIR